MDPVEEMLSLYKSWPRQLLQGFDRGKDIDVDSPSRVVFCGMGGSGVTGDFAKTVLDVSSNISSEVVKGFSLPRWVDPGTLVFGISYSGNTIETLSCVNEAVKKGARVISISSGGRLEELSRINGFHHVKLEPGYYPRTALAQMVGAVLGVLSRGTMISRSDVLRASERLEALDDATARDMARRLKDSAVIIVSTCGYMKPVAGRIRSELSENAKVLAKDEVYPESGHNDIVVWQEAQGLAPGFLVVKPGRDSLCRDILDGIKSEYKRHGVVVEFEVEQGSILEELLEASLLGGYFSVYLARYRGVDPRVTSIIDSYKKLLSSRVGS